MSDHENDWIVPNLLRRTGLHVVAGDGADEVAKALFAHATRAGASTLLFQPNCWGELLPMYGYGWRAHRSIIAVAKPDWNLRTTEQRILAEADVALRVIDGWIYTVHGGEPNARPVEVAKLIPSTPKKVLTKISSATTPRWTGRFRGFGADAIKPLRRYGQPERGWRKRFDAWIDQMQRDREEREWREWELKRKATVS